MIMPNIQKLVFVLVLGILQIRARVNALKADPRPNTSHIHQFINSNRKQTRLGSIQHNLTQLTQPYLYIHRWFNSYKLNIYFA